MRDEVFDLLEAADFRVDATIFEKPKARPHLQSNHDLYKLAWYLHFKFVAPKIVRRDDRLFVFASSLGTKKRRGVFASERQRHRLAPAVLAAYTRRITLARGPS